jgi:hypothetical protein
MNKASFLTLVRQASRISDQDVEELERLVVNFPYCQTAHLLIAKAAYDQGSMLSNQKLKKAAIYAANRQLLKKLIYTSDATVTLHPLTQPETVAEPAEKVTAAPVELETEIAPLESPVTETTAIIPSAEPEEPETEITPLEPEYEADRAVVEVALPVLEEINAEETSETETANEPEIPVTEEFSGNLEVPAENASLLEEIAQETSLYEDEVIAEEILIASAENSLVITSASESFVEPEIQITQPEPTLATSFFEEASILEELEITAEPASDIAPETLPETVEKEDSGIFIAEPVTTLDDVPDLHELFLENAPETLAEAPLVTEETAAQLASTPLNDDLLQETLASFDQYLFRPEKEILEEETTEDLKVVNPENLVKSIFEKDSIGYWMSSSRLGESLQAKDDLTTSQPYDFHPELLWEYSKAHELEKEIKPAPSKLTHQLNIIDQFLKMTPRLKTMANAKIKTEPQEDLSSKSSKINKNLASENFANILVQQGKIKKAIKIYEHMILKIPEKKAYFVAQIQKLQNQE